MTVLKLVRTDWRDRPDVQWVIKKDLDNGQYGLVAFMHQLHCLLTTTSEDTLDTSNAHSIDDISRQSERNSLWRWKDSPLLKRNTKVDVDELGRLAIYQYVLNMAISKSKNVSNH
jgi:hypothetical protein